MDCVNTFILFAVVIGLIVNLFKRTGKDQNSNNATREHQPSSSDDDGMVRMARGMIMMDMLEYGTPPWNVGDDENDYDQTDGEDYDTSIDYDDDDYGDSDYEGYEN